MILVQISDDLPQGAVPRQAAASLKRAAQAALATIHALANTVAQEQAGRRQPGGGPAGELTIVLGDDRQLHDLNLRFLGIDAPTDVLSFPGEQVDPESGRSYLGDILISYPRAEAQAQAGGHAVLDELQLLTVHGVLHLLGYDHAGPQEKAAMWAQQAAILTQIGCAITAPPPENEPD